MDQKKIDKYIRDLEHAAYLYHETSCSAAQIARHLDISETKVSAMIDKRFPKFYLKTAHHAENYDSE